MCSRAFDSGIRFCPSTTRPSLPWFSEWSENHRTAKAALNTSPSIDFITTSSSKRSVRLLFLLNSLPTNHATSPNLSFILVHLIKNDKICRLLKTWTWSKIQTLCKVTRPTKFLTPLPLSLIMFQNMPDFLHPISPPYYGARFHQLFHQFTHCNCRPQRRVVDSFTQILRPLRLYLSNRYAQEVGTTSFTTFLPSFQSENASTNPDISSNLYRHFIS